MKTSETVLEPGLYASGCCGHEQAFEKQDIFQRCPECHHLCEWELTETVVNPKKPKQEAA